jgi:hypothetical protein
VRTPARILDLEAVGAGGARAQLVDDLGPVDAERVEVGEECISGNQT